jgi:hypothetical protein
MKSGVAMNIIHDSIADLCLHLGGHEVCGGYLAFGFPRSVCISFIYHLCIYSRNHFNEAFSISCELQLGEAWLSQRLATTSTNYRRRVKSACLIHKRRPRISCSGLASKLDMSLKHKVLLPDIWNPTCAFHHLSSPTTDPTEPVTSIPWQHFNRED